jgi:hypothetical protein
MSILRDWKWRWWARREGKADGSRERAPDRVPTIGCAALRNLSGCVLYVETPQFAANRINAALGATAGILPDQQTLLQLPIRMARHP